MPHSANTLSALKQHRVMSDAFEKYNRRGVHWSNLGQNTRESIFFHTGNAFWRKAFTESIGGREHLTTFARVFTRTLGERDAGRMIGAYFKGLIKRKKASTMEEARQITLMDLERALKTFNQASEQCKSMRRALLQKGDRTNIRVIKNDALAQVLMGITNYTQLLYDKVKGFKTS